MLTNSQRLARNALIAVVVFVAGVIAVAMWFYSAIGGLLP